MTWTDSKNHHYHQAHNIILRTLNDKDAETYHRLLRAAQEGARSAHGSIPDATQDALKHQTLAAVLTGRYELATFDPIQWQTVIEEHRIEEETSKQRIRAEARRRLTAEQAGDTVIPAGLELPEFIATYDGERLHWLMDRLWPRGGRVLLAAAYKAGKTTLVANLLRSLVDGEPFLGEYGVEAGGGVLLIDTEMSPGQLATWLTRQNIRNEDYIEVLTLRGQLSGFNILDPDTRSRWAQAFSGNRIVILDNLRPVLDALGLDENHEAGKFLTAWDEFIAEMGASESLIVTHTGHNGERARGDSALLASNDAMWNVARESKDDPASPRYFSAFGRDVDEPKARISLDHDTGHLTISGGGPAQVAGQEAAIAVLQALRDLKGNASGRRLLDHVMGHTTHAKRAVLAGTTYCLQQGWITQQEGAKRALLHNLTPAGIAQLTPEIGAESTPEIEGIRP